MLAETAFTFHTRHEMMQLADLLQQLAEQLTFKYEKAISIRLKDESQKPESWEARIRISPNQTMRLAEQLQQAAHNTLHVIEETEEHQTLIRQLTETIDRTPSDA